jgi:hypothetical protein
MRMKGTRIMWARPGNNQLGERCCIISNGGCKTAKVSFVARKENDASGRPIKIRVIIVAEPDNQSKRSIYKGRGEWYHNMMC